MSLCVRETVNRPDPKAPHRDQGQTWGLSRPLDFLSQPLDSQGEVKVFYYFLSEISKWRTWEEKFVSWLLGWETDVSLWTVRDTKADVIEEELFFKEFDRSFPLPTDKTQILQALRTSYGW